MRKYTAVLFALLALLSSCAEKQVTDPDKLIQRKWTLFKNEKADTSEYITFSKDAQGIQHFFIRINTIESSGFNGTWNLENNKLTLQFVDTTEYARAVDSVSYSGKGGKEKLSLFYKGEETAFLQDGKLVNPDNIKVFEIFALTNEKLAIKGQDQTIREFIYIPKEHYTSFSLESVARGLLGIFVLILIAWALSENRKKIDWKLVAIGIGLQLVFAIGVLKVPFIESMFEGIGSFFIRIISFTQEGTKFLFSNFSSGKIENPLVNFVVMVLPTVIFFSALTSLLFYWGILQKIVYGLAWVMKKTMRLSGAESMAAAGNIFLGQTEAPLLIKPYLGGMTRSEVMCLMAGGMATIAGGVLAAYIGFLGGDDPQEQMYFAKHLLAASVMSAPAAIVAAKLLVPETEKFNEEMTIPKERIGSNALEAITNGTTDGLRLAANVAAMLLVFIAMIALANFILHDMIGEWTGLNAVIEEKTDYSGLSLQFIIGYAFAPIAYLLGVPWEDTVLVGQLMGEKTILNEFYAYTTLGKMKAEGVFVSEKSIIMATYILCGFSNFASIGIQIGGIGALAPNKKSTLSQLGFKALIGGTIACLFTAVIVGMLM